MVSKCVVYVVITLILVIETRAQLDLIEKVDPTCEAAVLRHCPRSEDIKKSSRFEMYKCFLRHKPELESECGSMLVWCPRCKAALKLQVLLDEKEKRKEKAYGRGQKEFGDALDKMVDKLDTSSVLNHRGDEL